MGEKEIGFGAVSETLQLISNPETASPSLRIEGMPAGIYLVKCMNSGKSVTKRLVISK